MMGEIEITLVKKPSGLKGNVRVKVMRLKAQEKMNKRACRWREIAHPIK